MSTTDVKSFDTIHYLIHENLKLILIPRLIYINQRTISRFDYETLCHPDYLIRKNLKLHDISDSRT